MSVILYKLWLKYPRNLNKYKVPGIKFSGDELLIIFWFCIKFKDNIVFLSPLLVIKFTEFSI